MIESQGYISSNMKYISVGNGKGSTVYDFPHVHNHYEIYYNISGARGYMVNGIFYKCCERDLIIVPRLQVHKVVVENSCNNYHRCTINIDNKLLSVFKSISSPNQSLDWLVEDNENTTKKTTLSNEQHETLMELIDKYQKQVIYEEKLVILAKILVFLRFCFTRTNIAEFMDKFDISNTDKIIMTIEKHFKNITVTELAELVHYNSDHLNRVFKAEMGVTVNHYLVLRKLVEAQRYLCMGKCVKDACKLSGFNNYSNFLRTFKKYLGHTPSEITDKLMR